MAWPASLAETPGGRIAMGDIHGFKDLQVGCGDLRPLLDRLLTHAFTSVDVHPDATVPLS
jgi:hypothetical protein